MDLELATLDQLTAELGRRFPNLVIVGLRDGFGSYAEGYWLHHEGSLYAALGLLDAATLLTREIIAKRPRTDGPPR